MKLSVYDSGNRIQETEAGRSLVLLWFVVIEETRQNMESQTNQLLVIGYRLQRQLLIIKTDYMYSEIGRDNTKTYTDRKLRPTEKVQLTGNMTITSLQHEPPVNS